MPRKRKPRVIHVSGRRWFQRGAGNTYHSVSVWVDGDCVYRCDFAYGYDRQYEYTAQGWLKVNGYLPGLEQHEGAPDECLWRYCERKGIKLVSEVTDVTRRKDL
jgi:hypothetical protein